MKGERKGAKKEEGNGKGEGKNKLAESLEKSWFSEQTAPDGQTRPICMRQNLSQAEMYFRSLLACLQFRRFNMRLHRPQSDCVSSPIT